MDVDSAPYEQVEKETTQEGSMEMDLDDEGDEFEPIQGSSRKNKRGSSKGTKKRAKSDDVDMDEEEDERKPRKKRSLIKEKDVDRVEKKRKGRTKKREIKSREIVDEEVEGVEEEVVVCRSSKSRSAKGKEKEAVVEGDTPGQERIRHLRDVLEKLRAATFPRAP